MCCTEQFGITILDGSQYFELWTFWLKRTCAAALEPPHCCWHKMWGVLQHLAVLGDLYSPLPAGGSPPLFSQLPTAIFTLIINMLTLPSLPGTPYFTKPSWALCRLIWVSSPLQVGNKNGHNGQPQGSPSCFLRDTIYVIRYLANVPLRRLVVVKRGAKVPRGPLLAGGYARIFIPRDASCRHGTRFSQRACRGPPHALGPTKERNMPDEEGEACPMTKTSWPWPRLSVELQPRCDIPQSPIKSVKSAASSSSTAHSFAR